MMIKEAAIYVLATFASALFSHTLPAEQRLQNLVHELRGFGVQGPFQNFSGASERIQLARTGKQAIQDDSVYCQQTPDGRTIPRPYGGTRRNIPCGLGRPSPPAPPGNSSQSTDACYPTSGQVAGAGAPAAVGVAAAINMAELWKRRIDTYWFETFRTQGQVYRPPMLIQAPGQLQYDPNTVTIEYDPAILADIVQTTGNFGLVVAMAHEEAHNVQFVRGRYLRFLRGLDRELDADRLAGAYLRWAQDHRFVRECDLAAALLTIFRHGDQLPTFDPQAHGTPQQRVDQLIHGFFNGPNPF
jgi:hypothetical protein